MVVKFDTPTQNSSGQLNNTGSSSAFVNYLGKEDEISQERGEQPEQWFSRERDENYPAEVRAAIDSDHQGIGKAEGKFATGSINPTEEEWRALGNTEEERSAKFRMWIQKDFSQEFAENFNKKDRAGNSIPIDPDNVKIYYKVEHDRYHTGRDEAVTRGEKRQGEAKDGFNVHCHFIVARKTVDGKSRISPTTNNRKEFDRDRLIHKTEQSFDRRVGYERPLRESYEYMKTIKNGTGHEKSEMVQRAVKEDIQRDVKIQREDMNKKLLQENSLTRDKSKELKLSRGRSLNQ